MHRLVVTFDDVDKVVEADTTVSLIGLLECDLQLGVLVLGDDAPLLIEDIVEIYSTLAVHSNYIISNTSTEEKCLSYLPIYIRRRMKILAKS